MRYCLLLPTLIYLGVFTSTTYAVTVHVPDDFDTIQAGIDACTDGDTVIVRDGTYTGDGNRDIDFTGKAIVLMSENGPEVTIIDCEGGSLDPHRGFYFYSGEDAGSVVQGFMITNGWTGVTGGGMFIDNSNPSITDCIFRENASHSGGGMYNAGSNPTVSNCKFIGNLANGEWGAGGGMANINSSPTVANCTFRANSATDILSEGGGMYNLGSNSSPVVSNCTFHENSAVWGSGIFNMECSPTIENCTFTENLRGSVMWSSSTSNLIVINCTFTRNPGGGMFSSSGSDVIVTNCIFWGNSGGEIDGEETIVTYSNVKGGWGGEGNIDNHPLFRNPESDDYHLMAFACGDHANSPCIDAGDPAISDSILDCQHGLGTSRSDMGAFGGRGTPPTSITESQPRETIRIPRSINLFQNYPNPFNPSTTIGFDLPVTSGLKQSVSLTIYDLRGRCVRTLIDSELDPGNHKIHWNGRDDRGQSVASGIYLYRLKTGDETFTRKMTVLK